MKKLTDTASEVGLFVHRASHLWGIFAGSSAGALLIQNECPPVCQVPSTGAGRGKWAFSDSV